MARLPGDPFDALIPDRDSRNDDHARWLLVALAERIESGQPLSSKQRAFLAGQLRRVATAVDPFRAALLSFGAGKHAPRTTAADIERGIETAWHVLRRIEAHGASLDAATAHVDNTRKLRPGTAAKAWRRFGAHVKAQRLAESS